VHIARWGWCKFNYSKKLHLLIGRIYSNLGLDITWLLALAWLVYNQKALMFTALSHWWFTRFFMPIELQAISENRHVLVTTVLTPVRVYKPRSCVCTPITSIGTQASGQRPGSRRVMGSMGALTGAAGLRYLEYSTGGGGGGAVGLPCARALYAFVVRALLFWATFLKHHLTTSKTRATHTRPSSANRPTTTAPSKPACTTTPGGWLLCLHC
jgi:hypothetical protein